MPLCTEKKITLAGPIHTYSCERVFLGNGFGILKYVIDREYDIQGIHLSPGDITYALYWEDRPYTLYIWYRTKHDRPVYYFNIADSIRLSPDAFVWRDLIIDILIDSGRMQVLDEDEFPGDLSTDLKAYVIEAKEHIINNYQSILEEARRELAGKSLSQG